MGGLVVLAIGLVIVGVVAAAAKSKEQSWTSGSLNLGPPPDPPKPKPPDFAPLISRDPEFSPPVFEDFVFQLYAAAQRGRDDPAALVALAPYLTPQVAATLASRGPAPSQIVIGTLRIASCRVVDNATDRIVVHIEATMITASPTYVVEQWTFTRASGVQSKPPVRTRTWPCPNCGAAWQGNVERKCQHCGEEMTTGRFDWCVESIRLESQQAALASLTGTVPEYGTDLPTVGAPNTKTLMAAITADDPEVTFDVMKARINLVYQRLNEAWNASDLKPVRGLVTTALRDYLQYWLDEYKRQGLRNRLEGAAIESVKLAKVTRDRHFDAITVRVTAGGRDFTLDTRDNIVGGSRSDVRRYSEYWTFVRSSSRRGPVNAEPKCPGCGAALAISDSGDCTHCNAAIESGSFDWLLSKIEQDDVYVG